jgi:mercuric reductase
VLATGARHAVPSIPGLEGLTVNDLTETFAPYLTMSEGLKVAAQAFDREVSKVSCCAA